MLRMLGIPLSWAWTTLRDRVLCIRLCANYSPCSILRPFGRQALLSSAWLRLRGVKLLVHGFRWKSGDFKSKIPKTHEISTRCYRQVILSFLGISIVVVPLVVIVVALSLLNSLRALSLVIGSFSLCIFFPPAVDRLLHLHSYNPLPSLSFSTLLFLPSFQPYVQICSLLRTDFYL